MKEQIEESSKGLEKRHGKIKKAPEEAQEKVCEVIIKVKSGCENKVAALEKELREKLNEGERQMRVVQAELKKEITVVADASAEALGTAIRTEMQEILQDLHNKQTELKKEITVVADASIEALGTQIQAEIQVELDAKMDKKILEKSWIQGEFDAKSFSASLRSRALFALFALKKKKITG